MNKISSQISLFVAKIDPTYIGVVLFLICVAMFVVAAGAPEAGGSSIR
jgi:hypothetical protein